MRDSDTVPLMESMGVSSLQRGASDLFLPRVNRGSATVMEISERIKQKARELGFALCGIAPAVRPLSLPHFENWLDANFQGEMQYLENRREAYAHPRHVLESVRSVIMTAVSYDPVKPGSTDENSPAEPEHPPYGKIARYARGQADYHDVLRKMLKQLAAELHELVPGCQTRGVVDTAPLLERDFAKQAGLGWFGKNTMLINKGKGSYFFLAAVLTDVELPADLPHETAHCGTCTRCLEICPTNALTEPYRLDARRCLAYLTIELRHQPIPLEFRSSLQDWMFGCDLCQEVCPWNRHAGPPEREEFRPAEISTTTAAEFLTISETDFRQKYRGTPLSRPGRVGMARNAAIVLGNSHDPRFLPTLSQALHDESPLVRGAAAWAIAEIGDLSSLSTLQTALSAEAEAEVREELQQALLRLSR